MPALPAPFLTRFCATSLLACREHTRSSHLIASLYQKWMHDWETRLTTRDTNRIVRPLEWGLDWAQRWPVQDGDHPHDAELLEDYLHRLNDRIVAGSEEFYSYITPTDFRLEN